MKETPTRKIDLDLENSIFSHDQRLCGEDDIGEPVFLSLVRLRRARKM
jgi:hypothetical protein